MEWIKSDGGPLICIERNLAHSWRGVANQRGGALEGRLSDYARACQVRDYLGVIDVEGGQALIFGDMPLETSVWRTAADSLFIIRLFYIDPGTDVPKILREIGDDCFDDPEESINFSAAIGQMIIFDSAAPGADTKERTLSFEIMPGSYRILSKVINPDSRTSILLHKFFIVM